MWNLFKEQLMDLHKTESLLGISNNIYNFYGNLSDLSFDVYAWWPFERFNFSTKSEFLNVSSFRKPLLIFLLKRFFFHRILFGPCGGGEDSWFEELHQGLTSLVNRDFQKPLISFHNKSFAHKSVSSRRAERQNFSARN